MSKQTTEKAFETRVEEILLTQGGWTPGTNAEWDKELALFPARVWSFIRETQPKLWEQMEALHGEATEQMLLKSLVKELDLKGALHVLRHGFKFYGKTFRLAYFKPAHGLNYDVIDLFNKNQATVTRQVPCHPGDLPAAQGTAQAGHSTVDMVLAINGLPVANPLHDSGYRTGYFWEDILQRNNFLDALGHFMFVEKRDEKIADPPSPKGYGGTSGRGGSKRVTRETMIFPRCRNRKGKGRQSPAVRDY